MKIHTLGRLVPLLALAATLAAAAPAAAASVSGGIWTGSGNAEVGGVLSEEFTLPASPASIELAIGAPLSNNNGRFAATASIVGHGADGYIGGGLGVGQLKSNGNSGLIFTGLIGTKIAGPLSVELRVYGGGSSDVGSGAFLGVKLSI
ncbi:MAG TPA: hypothetical protein VNJ51_02510 [Candidatus Dormibacteraeota bacterium]|nr:hypothetical protein [Candidatus Dormibacteraeota bacterium]